MDTRLHVGGQPVCSKCADLVAKGKRPLARSAKVQTRSQTSILGLISADLDLGFSLIEAAKAMDDPAQKRSNIEGAERALNSVRLFSAHIRDLETWKGVQVRIQKLETAIRARV